VIVKDLSRLGRTYIEVGELLFDTFPACNVRFISVNDDYDSFADDAGRKKLLILFKNLVNHLYSKDLGKKIRSAHAVKMRRGELLGALPPYGYLFTDERGGKRLKIEPESAATVKRIFDLRLQGYSMFAIANYLNQNDIPAPRNHYYNLDVLKHEKYAKKCLWQNGYLGQLLKNEVYIGHQIQGKYERDGKTTHEKPRSEWIVHENAHPAIVDRAAFDAVQILTAEAGEKYKKLGNHLGENILVGKIFCTRCGKAARRQHSHKNKREVTFSYYCRDCHSELRYTLGLDAIPKVSFDKIAAVISATIQKQIDVCLEPNSFTEKSPDSANRRRGLMLEVNRLRLESDKAAELLSAAYTHHLGGLLDSREFALAREKFERDRQTAEIGITRAEKALADYDAAEVRQTERVASFRKFEGFSALDRGIIDALIQRIEITPMSDIIGVTLNFEESGVRVNA
jgi:hypothetical protein